MAHQRHVAGDEVVGAGVACLLGHETGLWRVEGRQREGNAGVKVPCYSKQDPGPNVTSQTKLCQGRRVGPDRENRLVERCLCSRPGPSRSGGLAARSVTNIQPAIEARDPTPSSGNPTGRKAQDPVPVGDEDPVGLTWCSMEPERWSRGEAVADPLA